VQNIEIIEHARASRNIYAQKCKVIGKKIQPNSLLG
jgi:hypothetical protein